MKTTAAIRLAIAGRKTLSAALARGVLRYSPASCYG